LILHTSVSVPGKFLIKINTRHAISHEIISEPRT
jgi:hypothetical protein